MLRLYFDVFSWMPPPLEVLCHTIVLIFMLICLVQIIKLVVEVVKMILDIFGGIFGRVVGLFK